MRKTIRAMPRLLGLLIGALLLVALVAAAPAAAMRGRAHDVRGERSFYLPEGVQGSSATMGPGGVPWFGLRVRSGLGASIAHVRSGRLSIKHLENVNDYSSTGPLQFDAEGNLWFARTSGRGSAIVRRSPSGELTVFQLPADAEAISLAIVPDGDVWFTWSGYERPPRIGWVTPAGSMGEVLLAPGSYPRSAVAGPEGAVWFAESEAIDRITTGGGVQRFPLGKGVQPNELAVDPDGALWFSENGEPDPKRGTLDRIGRMTISGEVTQFRVPFGNATEAIAIDPRGAIWFSTEEGEISSISTAGTIGSRRCATPGCGYAIDGIAVASDGALWLSTATKYWKGCGGGSDLIVENEGTLVAKVPAGALPPAP